jgi:hypothetical protein
MYHGTISKDQSAIMMPIERVKFHLKPLVDEILDQLPDHMFTSDSTTFLDPAFGGGQFLREVVTRLLSAGHSDDNIRSRIYGCEITNFRVKYATQLGKVISDNLIKADFLSHDWGTMKFDVILGNPPYQDKSGNENSSNSADLYARFVEQSIQLTKSYVAMVIPSAWSGARDSRLKDLLFEQHKCTHFNTHGKKWFDVDMNTCWFITQLHRQGVTEVSDNLGNKVHMLLDKHSVILKDLSSLVTFNKLRSHAQQNNLAARWIRGKLNLNQADQLKKGRVPFVRAVGTKDSDLIVQMIPQHVEVCGWGFHKCVIPNVSSSDSIGNIKLASPDMVGGHSVVFMTAQSASEAARLKKYMESDLVKFLVKLIKISTPNSKSVFELIPNMPKSWKTNADLYAHFGLDPVDVSTIEKHN